MKIKFILCLFFSMSLMSAFAQCDYTENFEDDDGWSQVGIDVEIKDGQLQFLNGSTDDIQRRIYRELGDTLKSDDCWGLSFFFTPESVGSYQGQDFAGHFLAALTEHEQNALYNCPDLSCTGFPPGIQDAIIVDYTAVKPPDGRLLFKIITKIGGARYDSDYITYSELGNSIFVHLVKDCDVLTLSLYEDGTMTNMLGDGPVKVQIPEMNDLAIIQHGNNVGGDPHREMTGTLDNVCLKYKSECGTVIEEIIYKGCKGDGYEMEVNGILYNESNPQGDEYIFNLSGCDTIVIIDLEFDDSVTESISYEACSGDGFEIIVNDVLYNEANPGGYEYLTSVFGCDSIIEIDLRFWEMTESTIQIESCQGDTMQVIVGDLIYDENNPFGISVIENSMGCDSIITVDLKFRDCSCYIYFPNVFTPNNDGNNDHFQPVYDCAIYEYSMRIYDRWGNLVYTGSDPNYGWDGRFSELKAEVGVYTYLCVYSSHAFDIERKISGDVTLLR